jgi:hypothetical protein
VLNDDGEVAFSFLLDPLGSPFGMNAALYRRAAGATAPQALVSPDSTAAPGGGTFRGAFEAAIDAGDRVAFTGLTDSDAGYVPGVGSGAYVAAPDGAITAVAAPGDTAPGGGILDHAAGPSINAGGDVAFSAHVSTDPAFCIDGFLDCIASVFVRRAGSGVTEAVARQGAAVPGDDASRYLFALEPVLNDHGDVAYFAKLDPSLDNAILLRRGGATQQIVRDFQTIPDVGTVLLEFPTFRGFAANYAVDNRRQVAFRTLLFDEQSEFGIVTAACVWDAGRIRLLARAGTTVPGVGTIDRILEAVHLNERGQVLLHVDLTDGRRVLLRTR